MLEGFPAPWGLCSSPPRDVWAPQARECSRCISGRNQGTAWQRLGLLLSFAPYCQTLGFLFLQAGSALAWPRHPWHAEKEPCTSEIHSSSHQQSIPWELGGTGRAKPVPHPTSDQLLSPTLCCTATPCCPHETTGTLSGCTFLASQYSLLTQPASLSCLYHSLSCFSSPLPGQHPATIPTPPCQPTSPEELVPSINLGNLIITVILWLKWWGTQKAGETGFSGYPESLGHVLCCSQQAKDWAWGGKSCWAIRISIAREHRLPKECNCYNLKDSK